MGLPVRRLFGGWPSVLCVTSFYKKRSPPMPQNLEIKARIVDRGQAKILAENLGADFAGELQQTDTYFSVATGRLKLREFSDGSGELIFYKRPEHNLQRLSTYQIYRTNDAAQLRMVLSETLGVKVVVKKSRFLYTWKNARIHLDHVEQLGEFLEFEVLVTEGELQAEGVMRELRNHFSLENENLITCSYADLVEKLITRRSSQ
jgi:predicted adenylyl cyclase CyaB